MNTETSTTNAGLDAEAKRLNDGTLEVLDDAGNVLATLGFAREAFKKSTGGSCDANPLTPDENAAATGTAAGVRCMTKGGKWVYTGTAGTHDADAIFDSLDIQAGAQVSCERFTLTRE